MSKHRLWMILGTTSLLFAAMLYLSIRRKADKRQAFAARAPLAAPSAPTQSVSPAPTRLAAPKADSPDHITRSLQQTKSYLRQKTKLRAELLQNPHGTPASVMAAGDILGQVGEWETQFPERKKEFQAYYKDCFNDDETMTVTRVQCLRRYVRSTGLSAEKTAGIVAGLPSSVQRLYRSAASIP